MSRDGYSTPDWNIGLVAQPAPSTPCELSDGQTYDTPCAVCGKPLDGHTHELSADALSRHLSKVEEFAGEELGCELRNYIAALQSRLEADIACDRAYIEGCRLGYRLGLYEDREGRDAAIEARSKNIREVARGV